MSGSRILEETMMGFRSRILEETKERWFGVELAWFVSSDFEQESDDYNLRKAMKNG